MEKKLQNIINEKIFGLANDFESGSSTIARRGLEIFLEALTFFNQDDKDGADKLKDKIIKTKPSMSALRNIINDAYNLYLKNQNTDIIRKQIQQKIQIATEDSLNKAVKHINCNAHKNLATCSFSSTVIKLFQKLQSTNYNFNVYAIESPFEDRDYSHHVIEKCFEQGIQADRIMIENLNIENIDCCIIGADSVISGRGIVNGTPSLNVAGMLRELDIPLLVIAESFKNDIDVNIEEGFDFVPMEFISDIFSDSSLRSE